MNVNQRQLSEAHYRSVIKSLSYRFFATLLTLVISFMVTGKVTDAVAIGSFEIIAKLLLYYFHERLWSSFPLFGIMLSSHD